MRREVDDVGEMQRESNNNNILLVPGGKSLYGTDSRIEENKWNFDMAAKPDLKGGIERESGRAMSARLSSEGGFVLGGNKKGENKNMRVSL